MNSRVHLGVVASLHLTHRKDGLGCPELGSPLLQTDAASLTQGPDLQMENFQVASGDRWRASPDKVFLSFMLVSALGQGGSPALWVVCARPYQLV